MVGLRTLLASLLIFGVLINAVPMNERNRGEPNLMADELCFEHLFNLPIKLEIVLVRYIQNRKKSVILNNANSESVNTYLSGSKG